MVFCLPRLVILVFFFFFKQKTAYEMRISDWSSDVCSSDLPSLAASRADPAETYSAALDRWLASGAADLDERLPVVLADLGLDLGGAPEQALMTSLSGGQAARVGLAALLLSRFDIALLDEPTNDLDRSEEHTSELQSLMRTSYAAFC